MVEIPLGLKGEVKTVISVDWFDLDEYLRGKYQCQGTHIPLECSNDTTLSGVPTALDSKWATLYELKSWDEALEKYKNDEMEEYYLSAMLSAAVRDGHLPLGEYVVRVSW